MACQGSRDMLIFSLRTVALTNSICTYSELSSTTCCYLGYRGSHPSIMHHQKSLTQTVCCESLKLIARQTQRFRLVMTKAAHVKSCRGVNCPLNEGEFHLHKIALRRKAIQLMWSWEMKAWEHQWCISQGKWGTEMYGDNYFLQSSGLPPALVLCVSSVTDLCCFPETCACACAWVGVGVGVCVCVGIWSQLVFYTSEIKASLKLLAEGENLC